MAPTPSTPPVDNSQLFLRLIFLVISALFLVMTGIGGFTAKHLIDQVDGISASLSDIKTDIAVEKATQTQRDARISNIETFIYGKTPPQTPPVVTAR